MAELLERWQQRVRQAAGDGGSLRIVGGGSKDFYGGSPGGEAFCTGEHAGIVGYEPTELVVTVRSGTPIAEVEALLAANGQFLAFEPPRFGGAATVGGAVAAGLSGPRRQQAGSVRDFVLGVRLLDGRGELLRFGGEVMKNVAGYDVSRLVVGSLGTLGILVEVSLKVLPRPPAEVTLNFEMPQARAIERLNGWGGQPLPISASCWVDDLLSVRLSGAPSAVAAATAKLGGELVPEAAAGEFWAALRDQRHPHFAAAPLWRLSVPTAAPVLDLPAPQLIEWGGGQRWCASDADPRTLRQIASRAGGHATLFRGGSDEARASGVFAPLPDALMNVHRRLKQAFDPAGVFNPGRLYPDF